eukprot:Skav229722  [mRNA]  locus=scaffold49:353216:360839:- [translate_table: standard]
MYGLARSFHEVLQALGHVALLRLAALLGGDGFLGGVLPGIALAMLAFLHRLDYSRIHDVGMLELREKLVTSGAGARSAMMEVLNGSLLAVLLAALLLFGNELLVQHLLVTQLLAIKRLDQRRHWEHALVLSLRKAPKWRLLWWLDGALAVMLFLVLRILQMPFATADEHVWELYANKMRTLFPSYLGAAVQKEPTFNTRLYNAVSVFDFISWKNIEVGFQTKVYHLAALALAFQAGAFLLQIMPHAGKEEPPNRSSLATAGQGPMVTGVTSAQAARGGFIELSEIPKGFHLSRISCSPAMLMKVPEESDWFQKILPAEPASPCSMDGRYAAGRIVPLAARMESPSSIRSSAPSTDTSFSGPRNERLLRRIYLRRFLRTHGFREGDVHSARPGGCIFRRESTYPIHIAALQGDYDAVKMLLEEGVDIEKETSRGRTVMDCALAGDVCGSNQNMVRLLQSRLKR